MAEKGALMGKRALAAVILLVLAVAIMAAALSESVKADVVGRIVYGDTYFGRQGCDTGIQTDSVKVAEGSTEASWHCNMNPTQPHYKIGGEGTKTITLTPPSGYECDAWSVNYPDGGATNTNGAGCSATITALGGEWSTHLWFSVKPPAPPQQCKDDDGDKYSNCPPRKCGTGGAATGTPSGTGSCDIQGLDREKTDLDACSRTQPDCDTITVSGSCQVKVCAKGWKDGGTNIRYGNFRIGTNCRAADMDDIKGNDCDDDIKASYSWSVSGESLSVTTKATRHEADGVVDAGYTLEALNCEFSDGSTTKDEKVLADLPSDNIQTAQRTYTLKSCPTTAQDCDDANPIINPGSANPHCNCNDADGKKPIAEVCDGVDNDCDTLVDEGFDMDGDGYTLCSGTIDCDDSDATVYPGAPEKCDRIDHNCDGDPYNGVEPDDCEEVCQPSLFMDAGEGSISIRAKGENGNGWPAMQLWVAGRKASEWTVDSAEFKTYTANVPSFKPGQEVAVVFPNDYYSASPLIDRNLIVDFISIGGSVIQGEDKARTIYDRGDNENTYFDNQGIVSAEDRKEAGDKMAWNGALRIKDTSTLSGQYQWVRDKCCGDDADENVKYSSTESCGTGCCGSTECYDAKTKSCVASGKTAGDKYCSSGMWTDRSLVAKRIIDTELSYKSEKLSQLCGTYEEALNTYNYPILGRLAADYFKETCMATNRDGPCANELCVAEIDGKVFVAGSLNFEPQPSELKAMFNYDGECKAPFATDKTIIMPCSRAPDRLWYSKKTGIFVYGSEEFTLRFGTESDEFEQYLDQGADDPELSGKIYVSYNQDQQRTIFGFLSPPICGFDGTVKEEIQVTYMGGFATDICKATAHLGEDATCTVYESYPNRKTYKLSSVRKTGEYNSYFEAWLDLTAKLKARKACPANCVCDEFNDVIECPAEEVLSCTTDNDCAQPYCPHVIGVECPANNCINGECTLTTK